MICGLDISTSIIGYTILSPTGDVIDCNHWDLRKYKNFFEKVSYMESRITELKKLNISMVYVEQSLQSFRPGFSSAKTILTLSKFNGTISWLVYKVCGIEPQYIAASTARKACGIKVEKGQKAKEKVLLHVSEVEDSFNIEYTKFGNPKQYFYDRADSYVIAKAGFFEYKKEI